MSDDEDDPVGHAPPHQVERRAGQIGMPPFARAGVLVEGPEGFPMFGPQVVAAEMANLDPVLRPRAFLAQILAFA